MADEKEAIKEEPAKAKEEPKAEPTKEPEKEEIDLSGDYQKALESMGYKHPDEVLAEKEGKTVEEYRKAKEDKEKVRQAEQILNQKKFEKMATEDLAALKSAGLVSGDVVHIANIPNAKRFCELREKGASPVEAYRAVNGQEIADRARHQAEQNAMSKEHLQKMGSTKAAGNQTIPTPDMAFLESLYRGRKVGKETIESAYKRANGI